MNSDIIKLSLVAYINILKQRNWSNPQIAKAIGVTPYQVYLYGLGKTERPRAVICKNIFEGPKVEGKSVLLSIYDSYEELIEHYNIEVK